MLDENSDSGYRDVYEVGYAEGVTGRVTPDDNPYRDESYDPGFRFYWGEGLFDGFKVYLSSQSEQECEAHA